MRCPSGGDCFALECRLAGSCQGYDVEIEAVTVIHTSIRRRAVAEASLTVASPLRPGYQPEARPEGAGEPLPPPRKP